MRILKCALFVLGVVTVAAVGCDCTEDAGSGKSGSGAAVAGMVEREG